MIVGDSYTGKTTILSMFVNKFFKNIGSLQIGHAFSFKFISISGKRIKLIIWDTSGEHRLRTLNSC